MRPMASPLRSASTSGLVLRGDAHGQGEVGEGHILRMYSARHSGAQLLTYATASLDLCVALPI